MSDSVSVRRKVTFSKSIFKLFEGCSGVKFEGRFRDSDGAKVSGESKDVCDKDIPGNLNF